MAYDTAEPADKMGTRRVHASRPDSGMARSLGLIATLIVLFLLGYIAFA